MKIRNGFVSNSSSSCYIINLPKDYKFSREELEAIKEEMMENRGNVYSIKYKPKSKNFYRRKNRLMMENPEKKFDFTEFIDDDDNIMNWEMTDELIKKETKEGMDRFYEDGHAYERETYGYYSGSVDYTCYVLFKALGDKIIIDSFGVASEDGCLVNIASKKALKKLGKL